MKILRNLTRSEAADYLGVKPSTLAVWACTKRYNLPYYKIGSRVMYKLADLDDFINRNMVEMHSQSFV